MSVPFQISDPRLQFTCAPISRAEWIAAVSAYAGWHYNLRAVLRPDNVPGYTDCFRLFAMAARDKSLLAADSAPEKWRAASRDREWRAAFLRGFLEMNFASVPLDEMRAGDVLLMNTDEPDAPPLHLGQLCEGDTLFHCYPGQESGAQSEDFVNFWRDCVESAWALRGFID